MITMISSQLPRTILILRTVIEVRIMAKSKINSRKGYTACLSFSRTMALRLSAKTPVHWRFPNGFVCPECANKTCCRLKGGHINGNAITAVTRCH